MIRFLSRRLVRRLDLELIKAHDILLLEPLRESLFGYKEKKAYQGILYYLKRLLHAWEMRKRQTNPNHKKWLKYDKRANEAISKINDLFIILRRDDPSWYIRLEETLYQI